MKKQIKYIALCLSSAVLLAGCSVDSKQAEEEAKEEMVREQVMEAFKEYFEEEIAGMDPAEEVQEDTEDVEEETEFNEVLFVSSEDYYDREDDISFQKGMRTIAKDSDSEKEFLSYFIDDNEEYELKEYDGVQVYLQYSEDENTFVFIKSLKEDEYPKSAYGFKYPVKDAESVAIFDDLNGVDIFESLTSSDGSEFEYSDFLKPLTDYQEKNVVTNDEGKTVKVEYSWDAEEYGTTNSTGVLYYDEEEMPLYREYYYTSGSKISFYLFEDGKLVQYFDFGGMAYSGLESNPDIETGIDFITFIFDRAE